LARAASGAVRLDEANRLEHAAFTDAFGAIFEHSPWVAERAWAARPFDSLESLHAAMCAQVAASDEATRLALLRAHPRLADKAALRAGLSADSQDEQRSAGLDQCSPEELAQLGRLNDAYDARFGFPFIIAVRGLGRREIIAALEQRLGRSREEEFAEALRQVEAIAKLRLSALFAH
jgi:2-oxo-4-hydroxy-4-carboxy-5-ureidoimidazoline decarboxylase